MEKYKDIDGDSGVEAFEAGKDFIKVRFEDGTLYLYTNKSAGKPNIDKMKKLAATGEGLNAFINTHVKTSFEIQLK